MLYSQVECNAYSLEDIINIKPVDDSRYIRPDFPANRESNHEMQQAETRRMLSSLLTNMVDNANIDEINEQLKRCNLTRLTRPPQQSLVEVLPNLWPTKELQRVGRSIAMLFFSGAVDAGRLGVSGA
jgi:hypothetical protein